MVQQPVIGIFDIGKTNKKVLLFNQQYQLVREYADRLPETADEDGDPCEDLQHLDRWIQAQLLQLQQDPEIQLKAINVSAYGASFVYIDAEGNTLTPLYNYLKTYPATLQQRFYRNHGPEKEFCRQTASPSLGSLNSGLQLYRIKYYQPRVFRHMQYALHLPQYVSWKISGHPVTELTSIGCHTGLWDFEQDSYHQWVYEEELASRFPPLVTSDQVLPVELQGQTVLVGSGLHDSSAALIPYLQQFTDPFVLISTGTWSISLNPFNNIPLSEAELEQDCLCYLTYQGKPVKAARFFLGYAHEQELKKIAAHFHQQPDFYKSLQPDQQVLDSLEENFGEQQYSSLEPSLYKDYTAAYHALMLKLVALQKKTTDRILQGPAISQLFVDGGFAGNSFFMQLLAAAYPDKLVAAASMQQGTALGAALALHHQWNTEPLPTELVALTPIQKHLSLYKTA